MRFFAAIAVLALLHLAPAVHAAEASAAKRTHTRATAGTLETGSLALLGAGFVVLALSRRWKRHP
jgi:hypothetical protein